MTLKQIFNSDNRELIFNMLVSLTDIPPDEIRISKNIGHGLLNKNSIIEKSKHKKTKRYKFFIGFQDANVIRRTLNKDLLVDLLNKHNIAWAIDKENDQIFLNIMKEDET